MLAFSRRARARTPGRLLLCFCLAATAALFGGAASSSAAVFCVHRAHCHGIHKPTVRAAARAAVANGRSRDRILVGPGHFGGDVSDSVDPTQQYATRRPFDLLGQGPRTVLDAQVDLQGGNITAVAIRGRLYLDRSTADRVRVSPRRGRDRFADAGFVVLSHRAKFRRGSVRATRGVGVQGLDGRSTFEDSSVSAPTGIQALYGSAHAPYSSGLISVRRVRIFARRLGIENVRSVSDSLIRMSGPGTAISAYCDDGDLTRDATNVTLVGDGSPGSTGAVTKTDPESAYPYRCGEAHLNLRSSVVRGFETSLREDRGGPCGPPGPYQGDDCRPGEHSANVLAASYSDYDPSRVGNDRPLSVDAGHNVNVDPRFVAAGRDFHLRFDSPLLGIGAPSRLAGLGNRDVGGHRRLIDADRDGTPDIDIGAYEYQGSGPRAVIAFSPSRPFMFMGVRFNGGRSSSPDGGPLSYRWDFGDGTSGDGRRVTHEYTTSGVHRAYLTVTDYKGDKSIASRAIRVRRGVMVCGHRC